MRRFPVEDHDASLARVRQGRLAEALLGFEAALQKARHAGDETGIDAVPTIVRMGETLCLQGLLDKGLDEIEHGLLASRRSRGWIDYLQATVAAVKGLSNDVRGIEWYTSKRRSQPGMFVDTWPVAIAKPDVLVENVSTRRTVVGEPIRLDVLELYLAQARGLWLRYQLLGETFSETTISREILEAFPEPKADLPEVIRRSHQVCRGLAMIGAGQATAGFELIERQLTVQSEWDHPLTGVALLVLSDRARRNDDRTAAFHFAAEASLLFARYEQYEWMVDTVERLGSLGALQRRVEAQAMLERIATWLRPRSDLAHVSTLSTLALLAADLDMTSEAETFALQSLRTNPKSAESIPRSQLTSRFVQARALLQKGRLEDGLAAIKKVGDEVSRFQGTGTLARHLVQMQRLVEWHQQKKIPSELFYRELNRLLDGPSVRDWQDQPMECFAAATADLEPYAIAWNRSFLESAPSIDSLVAFDRLQRLRQRYRLPLAARDLDLRFLLHEPAIAASPALAEHAANLRKALPTLDQLSNAIRTTVVKAASISAIDAKDWSPDEKKTWTQLIKQCDEQETRLADACARRLFVPHVFPPSPTTETLVDSKENFLGFMELADELVGYAVLNGTIERWGIESPREAFAMYQQLIEDLGVDVAPSLRNATLLNNEWKPSANRLRKALIPDRIWSQLVTSTHLTIIPDGWIWYVPFETFPMHDAARADPWIAKCSLQYTATLGLLADRKSTLLGATVGRAPEALPVRQTLFVHASDFFTSDDGFNKTLALELSQVNDPTKRIALDAKIQASRWTKIQFDRVVVGASTTLEYGEPFAPLAYDANGVHSLRQWLRLPLHAPRELCLIGNDMPTGRTSAGAGVEVGRLALCMAASGNRTLLISRWPTRGESSAILVKNFLEQLEERASRQAWQHSVLSLWETPLQENFEPTLVGTKRNRDSFLEDLTGQHPIFWANMMLIQN